MVSPGGVFIALGSNLEDRAAHIRGALEELGQLDGIHVIACSALHETEAVDGPPQPRYLNAVAELGTELSPYELLERMQEIERQHGRERTERNGPRTLDLDLLIFRDHVIDDPHLQVPHPRMWQRAFVMQPLAEICDLGRLVAARRLRCTASSETAAHVRRRSGRETALA